MPPNHSAWAKAYSGLHADLSRDLFFFLTCPKVLDLFRALADSFATLCHRFGLAPSNISFHFESSRVCVLTRIRKERAVQLGNSLRFET